MTRIRIIAIAAAILMSASQAWAQGDTGYCRITEMSHQYDEFITYVKLDCTATNPDSCTYNNWYALYDATTAHNDYKNKMPYLMAAFLQSKLVSLHLDGCTPIGHPRIRMVQIKQP